MKEKIFSFIGSVFSFIFSTIPAVYFVVVELRGQDLGLSDSSGCMKPTAVYIFWGSVVITIIYNLVQEIKKKSKHKKNVNGQKFLNKIIASTNNICKKKKENMYDYIAKYSERQYSKNPYWIINKPNKQIKCILDEIVLLMSEVLDQSRDEVGVSIIYTFDDIEWKIIHKNLSGSKVKNEIIEDPKSTINHLITQKKSYVYLADKFKAAKQGKYILNRKDNSNSKPGSIMSFVLPFDELNFKAILSITTYGKIMCKQSDKKQIDMLRLMIKPFKVRLKLELLNLFIKEQHANRDRSKAS